MEVRLPHKRRDRQCSGVFTFDSNKNKLRQVCPREGHYLLRSNLTKQDPAKVWACYIQLTEIEQAFKELKSATQAGNGSVRKCGSVRIGEAEGESHCSH